ncbi:MAG: Gldg family protein, partial [candidate division Zixibacteria bacterium]|nr:Gldg family protein [candidate division Zixibacteria bacterium]
SLGVVVGHFEDFSRGAITGAGLIYFASIVSVAIYLNVAVLGRRRWIRQRDSWSTPVHHWARSAAVVIGAISVNAILAHASFRIDATAEGLHSLSGESKMLLSQLNEDRPVFIQAYISKDVPQNLVQTRKNVLSYLREIDAVAGDRVQVIVHETEPFTEEALDARDKFGIQPRELISAEGARTQTTQIYLGVAITCGAREEVIPFIERGMSVEYELIRSVRMVAETNRKKVGVLITPLKIFGGFDFQSMASSQPWQVIKELQRQYEVVQISAAEPITEELDGLVVALPSSLPQTEMDNLKDYMLSGNPTLLLIDPLPTVNIGLSPVQESGAQTNPFMRSQGPQPDPKGNVYGLMNSIGISWSKASIIWDSYNPHPDFAHLPPEVVFVGAKSGAQVPFNQNSSVTSGLQELVLLYPGYLNPITQPGITFTPLLTSSPVSGNLNWQQLVQRSFFGVSMNRNPRRGAPTPTEYIFAASIKGEIPSSDSTALSKLEEGANKLNVIVVADLDFISSQFFQIRNLGIETLTLDNITFFLNCMDNLTGDTSFVNLRKKRIKHRTLVTIEDQVREFSERRIENEKKAELDAQTALLDAQKRLNDKVAAVRNRDDLDDQTKQVMSKNLQEAENRKFEALRAKIEATRESKVQASREKMEIDIRNIQNRIKTLAVALPPIPALLIGLRIFARRRKRETEGAAAARRLRS